MSEMPKTLMVGQDTPFAATYWSLHDPSTLSNDGTLAFVPSEAAADELARRWNAHEALVEACEAAIPVLGVLPDSGNSDAIEAALSAVQAALAAAKGD